MLLASIDSTAFFKSEAVVSEKYCAFIVLLD